VSRAAAPPWLADSLRFVGQAFSLRRVFNPPSSAVRTHQEAD
jgi:hypothetical protein